MNRHDIFINSEEDAEKLQQVIDDAFNVIACADANASPADAIEALRASLAKAFAPEIKVLDLNNGGRVVVMLDTCDGARSEAVGRFHTIADAEAFLGGPGIDAKALHEGRYTIDTPHGVANDQEAVALANKLGFQVFWSMGSTYYAPRGVSVSGNVHGRGWKGSFDSIPAAALAALATIEP